MQLSGAKNNGFAKKEDNSESTSTSQEAVNLILINPEHFKKLQEQINTAFSESERQNDTVVSKAKEGMINQTMASILLMEERNNNVINELLHSITNKSTKETVDPPI